MPTREQIENATNEELNSWVVTYIFEKNWSEDDFCMPPFSTRMNYVWQIVPMMQYFSLVRIKPDAWQCQSKDWSGKGNIGSIFGGGKTAPIAICRAALLAVLEDGN